MEKKNVVFLTVLAIATLLTAVVGTTFAYFTATVNTGTITPTTVTTAGDLGITYSDGAQITGTNIVPGWKSVEKTITVTNNSSSTALKYQIAWADVVNTFAQGSGSTDDLVYSLTKNGNNAIADGNKATTNAYVTTTLGEMVSGKAYSTANGVTIDAGTTDIVVAPVPANGATTEMLVPETEIAAGATHTYVLRVYFAETGVTQNENQSSAGTTVAAHCSDGSEKTQAECETAHETDESVTWIPASTTGAKNVNFSATLAPALVATDGIRTN